MIKLKVSPSSAAFMLGNLCVTEYAHGCLRAILMSGYGIREDSIAEVNERVGASHESWYARSLTAPVFGAEVPVKGNITDTVVYSGRADFITQHDGFRVIHETKATVTVKTKTSVITNGNYKMNWLAQLLFYMIRTNTTRGKIISGYYVEHEGGLFENKASREFKVEIDDVGNVQVDGQFSGYNVQDQLAHQMGCAKVLSENILWDRPDGAEKAYGSPCHFCPFKQTCLEYDLGTITSVEEFVASARKNVENKLK